MRAKTLKSKIHLLQERKTKLLERKETLDAKINEIDAELQSLQNQEKVEALDRIISSPDVLERLKQANIVDDKTLGTIQALYGQS